jgi:predicted MFS family arabinose efflux permease
MYFKKRRSLAVGIVSSAVGVGAICWGPLTQYLLKTMEWRNIFRIMAGLFVLMSFLTIFYDPNVEKSTNSIQETNPQEVVNRRRRFFESVFDTSIWRVPVYTIAVLSNMIACFGHHTPQIHLVIDL